MNCRFCGDSLCTLFLSLGSSPLANSFLSAEDLHKPEPWYPLELYLCDNCFLVQLEAFESPDTIFSHYAYFSSYSESWLNHCRRYTHDVISRFNLGPHSLVVEAASNDGYLLQYFAEKNIPILGIEPAHNVAESARKRGIPTESLFLGKETGTFLAEKKGYQADLLIGNNVLAHVPDLNDFIDGICALLKPDGILTMEFPHLMSLIEYTQFDTIYHEHFSYFSYLTVEKVFAAHGITIFDVEEIPTHGGSLRIYAMHAANNPHRTERLFSLAEKERQAGYNQPEAYKSFHQKVSRAKEEILFFFLDAKRKKKKVAGYGAPAKANTLLNYCGIKQDLLEYTVDKNPCKQNLFLPGSRIPIKEPDHIIRTKPDYLVILPWNLKEEIIKQEQSIKEWGGKFVSLIPKVEIV